ncbi:isocitrate/isopropylmalate dehydrogenase family protein [Bacillus pumilus]|uniref:isocitrate/isopropylmalate dehydrogenase family protein n=1 Tax=Bacillus TaxID=1386 RepID=UPI000D02EA76|nr:MULTISPECIES: isocitrate/isopropylmalate dehydrogenase family protein [Bacillus]MCK6162513.1 isocitrate/isopropylmalate dehydrogenase family protein [Bacillus pumilus]MCK6183019.1 isocitrate/isopropylmalate dehydrogenase family protein [Bacillus pumilus]PRS54709.1 3-isopropylmalate dehydrogenase [Bacillus sp. LNXM10]
MKSYRIGVLKGDGIGPEIVQANMRILKAALSQFQESFVEYVECPIGFEGIHSHQDPVPASTIEELKKCHGWILGPHDSASYPEILTERRNPSGELRHTFDLFANIRPSQSLPGVQGLVQNVDLVIFRENTEGFYPDRNMYHGVGEWMITPEVAISTGVFTKKAITRIAHAAFQSAMERRRKVTIVHKANVIKLGSGLFLRTCQEVAKAYPHVTVEDLHIDAMAAHLVRRAGDFDVIVTENMFGDILSDLTGELVGSLGIAPSLNCNENQAMAQAAHGSAPDIAGQNIANPMGLILSTVMLFDWLYVKYHDNRLKKTAVLIRRTLDEMMKMNIKTKDLGGSETTTQFTDAFIQMMNQDK